MPLVVDMPLHGEHAAGAAKRRRDRRLRAWHRHVRTTVAMELATALHHSAQRVEVPREGVEGEQHYAPRRPKPPLPGKRPGLPPEPEPQVRAATVGYVAAPVPVLSMPSLADTMADQVDDRAVQILLQLALERKKREEEKEERRRAEEEKHERRMQLLNQRVGHDMPLTEAEWAAWRQWMGIVPSSSSSAGTKRKRKKKRKKKLPRSGYKFLPRSRRLFGTNSTLFLREGGPLAPKVDSRCFMPLWFSSGP